MVPVGLGFMSENSAVGNPASLLAVMASVTMAKPAKPGSVTKSGLEIPDCLQVFANSEIRPAPNLIDVGKAQFPLGPLLFSLMAEPLVFCLNDGSVWRALVIEIKPVLSTGMESCFRLRFDHG